MAAAGAAWIAPRVALAQPDDDVGGVGLEAWLRASDCCIVGIPVARQSVWTTLGGRTRLLSYHEVIAEACPDRRARIGDRFVVRTLGGTLDGVAQWVPQEARLTLGAPALMFLEPVEPGTHAVCGMAAGVLEVVRGEDGVAHLRGAPRGGPGLHGLTLERAFERIAGELARAR